MKKILLSMVMMLIAIHADLNRDNTTQIVTDSKTALQWKDDAIGSTMTWMVAINYCESLTFATHSDWRLPNLRELTSLIDDSKISPSIDTSVVEHTMPRYYWSATTSANDNSYAWLVDFNSAALNDSNKSSSHYLRCVRAGQ